MVGLDPPLPAPRGPVSALVLDHLPRPAHRLPTPPPSVDDPLTGEDTHLALYCCYELHYRGFADVDPGWEWEPSLLALRRRLEGRFLAALAPLADEGEPTNGNNGPTPRAVSAALRRLIDSAEGPSLSAYMAEEGTVDQLREFAVHRSLYQLKEADPHTWGIPRLAGRSKSAMVAIQADEYGEGRPGQAHAELFAATMAGLGLDPTYGAYLDAVPGVTLATTNLVSLFGLHRRWRGALVGHLATFEMTSVTPMGRYAEAIRGLGFDDRTAAFYDVHVAADAEHEVIAAGDLIEGLVESEPRLAGDALFGARALMAVEGRFTEHLLGSWRQERSSLRRLPADLDRVAAAATS